MPDQGDYISVDQAVETYTQPVKHTRTWWFARISEGDLTAYEFPGDRKTYLKRSDIEAFLQFRPKHKPSSADGGEQAG
jgi:hypothetical protein